MAFKSVLLRVSLAAILGAAPVTAMGETPMTGGFLTYAIPADAPPSFDAHREATFACSIIAKAEPSGFRMAVRSPSTTPAPHHLRLAA